MKRTKIKKDPKVTLSAKDLTKIKRDVTKEATDKACLVILAAACDEFGLTEKQTGIKIMDGSKEVSDEKQRKVCRGNDEL